MQDKLQELTQKIYNEGVNKANQEADEIVENANKKASEIRENAKKEAEKIKADAENEAAETRKKVEAELKQASLQTLRTVKQNVVNMLASAVIDQPVKDAFNDKEFMQKVLEAVIKNWDASNANMDILVILPENTQKELVDYFKTKLAKQLNNGIELTVDSGVKAGFKIGPADGSYQITFKEEDFENLFKHFLRPKTNEMLFQGA